MDLNKLASRLWPYLARFFIETGTFTPSVAGSTTPGTITHTSQQGAYTRTGNSVFVRLRITISTITVAPTGNLILTGLPFTSTASDSYAGTFAIGFLNNITLLASTRFIGANVATGVTVINLTESPSAGTSSNIPATALAANAWIVLSGVYHV